MTIREIIQEQALHNWEKSGRRGLLAMGTGTGKSKVGVEAAVNTVNRLPRANILVVTPTEKLRDTNWPEEFRKWGYGKLLKNVTGLCYASLHKHTIDDYDLVILDEAHHLTEASAMFFIGDSGTVPVMCLTATPPKKTNCTEDERVKCEIFEQLKIPTVYIYTLEQAREDKVVADFNIVRIKVPLDDKRKYIEAGTVKKKFRITEQKNYDYLTEQFDRWNANPDLPAYPVLIPVIPAVHTAEEVEDINRQNEELIYDYETKLEKVTNANRTKANLWAGKRRRMIMNSASKIEAAQYVVNELLKQGKRVLVFCSLIKMSELICKSLVYNGKTGDDVYNAFCEGDIDVMGVCNIVNEGNNIPGVDVVVILDIDSAETKTVQRIGRMLRNDKVDKKATAYLIEQKGTRDEAWANNALNSFNKDLIEEKAYNKPIGWVETIYLPREAQKGTDMIINQEKKYEQSRATIDPATANQA